MAATSASTSPTSKLTVLRRQLGATKRGRPDWSRRFQAAQAIVERLRKNAPSAA